MKLNSVELVPHSENWREIASSAAQNLHTKLGPVLIEVHKITVKKKVLGLRGLNKKL